MSYKTSCLFSALLLLAAMSAVEAQTYSDFANSGPIRIENNSITYAPGSTALNVWDGSFLVASDGAVSGSGTIRSFANKAPNSKTTNFTVLNMSRVTGIQTAVETNNWSTNDGFNYMSTNMVTTTSSADFNATVQIGSVSGRKAILAQIKGIISYEKNITTSLWIYNDPTYPGTGWTNNYLATNYYTTINGVIFGPAPQAGYINASGSESSYITW